MLTQDSEIPFRSSLEDGPLKTEKDQDPSGPMPLPGVTDIGKGIDVVNQPYGVGESLRRNLFDITARITSDDTKDPDLANAYAEFLRNYGQETWGLRSIRPERVGRSSQHFWSGSTFEKMQKSVQVSASVEGKYYGFSGQVEGIAKSENAKSVSSFFCTYHGMFPKYRLTLDPSEGLRPLLKEEVREALDTWDASKLKADFFPRYGGYYLHSGFFGGYIHYTKIRNASSTMSESDFKLSMKASYDFGIGDVSGSASVENKKKHEAFSEQSETIIYADGGTVAPKFANAEKQDEWLASIMNDPRLIGFSDSDEAKGCQPVWNLTEGDRKALVEEAFYAYAQERQKTYAFHDPFLVPLYAYRDWSSYDLRRWFFTTDPAYPASSPWKRQKVLAHVYKEPRIGCVEFNCVRKKVKMKTGIFKSEEFYYHKIAQKVPSGWESIAKFYAPTKPLAGSLDKWVGFFPWTRNEKGNYSGQYYDLKGAKPGAWTQKGKVTFYGVRN